MSHSSVGPFRRGSCPVEGTPLGIAVAASTVLLVGATVAAKVIPERYLVMRCAVLLVVVVLAGIGTCDAVQTLVTAGVAFLLANAFLENGQAVLSCHGVQDCFLILGLLICAGLGLVLGEIRLWLRHRRAAAEGNGRGSASARMALAERRGDGRCG
ncbi:MAG: hypothetical protein QG608_823 [Actinomycetota bacterium]|nr:hypothetical protein [Actinomycetota bacterium]